MDPTPVTLPSDGDPTATRKGNLWPIALLLGWIATCGAGIAGVAYVAAQPGTEAIAPSAWPTESTIPRTKGHQTLLMFAHARCACTRASLHELRRTLARTEGNLDTWIVLSGPTDDGVLSVRQLALEIPGVHVVDHGEAEVARFAARTSGQVLVYAADGQLTFHGGLTASRGHEGDSASTAALLRVIRRPQEGDVKTAVFGCGLVDGAKPSAIP